MPDATPQEAASRLQPTDTLGIPLGTGQPPAFMAALGDRDDWADLRIYGALLLAWSEAFRHPHVHYLSGFFGPVERSLRDAGRQHQLRARRLPPLRAAARAAGAAGDGHGRRAARRRRAGAASRCTPAARSRSWPAPAPTPIGCWWSRPRRIFPAPSACGPTTRTRSTSTRSTCSCRARRSRSRSPSRSRARSTPRSPSTRVASSPTAPTLQTGIGTIPRRSSGGWPRAAAATTASTPRCSPTGSCACTRRARSPTARASSTASRWPRSPAARPSSTPGSTATRRSRSCRSRSSTRRT